MSVSSCSNHDLEFGVCISSATAAAVLVGAHLSAYLIYSILMIKILIFLRVRNLVNLIRKGRWIETKCSILNDLVSASVLLLQAILIRKIRRRDKQANCVKDCGERTRNLIITSKKKNVTDNRLRHRLHLVQHCISKSSRTL
jgi:hypothetical protein